MIVIAHYNEVKKVLRNCREEARQNPQINLLLSQLHLNAKAYTEGVVKEGHTTRIPPDETVMLQANLVSSLSALKECDLRFPDLPYRDLCECLVTAMES